MTVKGSLFKLFIVCGVLNWWNWSCWRVPPSLILSPFCAPDWHLTLREGYGGQRALNERSRRGSQWDLTTCYLAPPLAAGVTEDSRRPRSERWTQGWGCESGVQNSPVLWSHSKQIQFLGLLSLFEPPLVGEMSVFILPFVLLSGSEAFNGVRRCCLNGISCLLLEVFGHPGLQNWSEKSPPYPQLLPHTTHHSVSEC